MPTKIEWTDETWNPITGCSPVSEGCQNCYAKRMANRLRGRYGYPKDDPFKVTYHHDRLEQPLKWKKPRMIFVCSMGDLFHRDIGIDSIIYPSIFHTINRCRQHTFMLLTKRPAKMKRVIKNYNLTGESFRDRQNSTSSGLMVQTFPGLPNVWLGVTAENQSRYEERWKIAQNLTMPLFISVEPMLGPIEFMNGRLPDYVICGAETGPGARHMDDKWAFDLFRQCRAYKIPFFFKKWKKREFPKQRV